MLVMACSLLMTIEGIDRRANDQDESNNPHFSRNGQSHKHCNELLDDLFLRVRFLRHGFGSIYLSNSSVFVVDAVPDP
jgi:hypothetical protein